MSAFTKPHPLADAMAHLLRSAPDLAFEMAGRAGISQAGTDLRIRCVETEYPDPHEPNRVHRTDVVFVGYLDVRGVEIAVEALVLEILFEKDPRRPPGWLVYPEAVRQRYGCLGKVMILAPDPEVQAWAQEQARAQASADEQAQICFGRAH